MEAVLQASEPQLASMFAIFARLNADDPVGAERVTPGRLARWRPAMAIYAVVLVPLMFTLIVVGALVGGGARNVRACDLGYSAGGSSPQVNRSACQMAEQTTSGITTFQESPAGKPPSGNPASGKPTSGAGGASCTTAAPDTRSAAAWTGVELAFPLREVCYK